ncbi:conserved phage C-terminal domain-containing protein [Lactococcus lactis]|uniref:Conserved phage C-terminal domain-containing protein n=3 Tax=Lactococcus TaxID=1357 RepID=A0A9X4NJB5_9LACT|nr:conserved phage C-terminal domain-containing protein [Lactococcus lactis]MDG4985155.1 conserved phage C-terminal domain-containing protein [Lactococcus lactis]
MAQRRMFSKKIVETDFFMEMSPTAKLLYFYLNMSADDDGFVGNPKTIKLISGATDDDLKILIAKQFIIPFESGVVVIKDWKIHNYIRKDTYNSTVYKFEKSQLLDDDNGAYILNQNEPSTERPREVDTGKDRLGKDRLGKSNNTMSDKSDDVIPYSEILDYLNKKTSRSFRNVEANKKLIRTRWNEGYKLDDFKAVIDNMVVNWSGKNFNGVPAENYLQPKTLFSNKFDSYLNQTQIKSTNSKVVKGVPEWSNPQTKKDREYMTNEEVEALINGLGNP